MFSPKKLGLIGLLLLNTFKTIQALELNKCEDYTTINFNDCAGKTPVKYCIKDNSIIGINASNSCTGAIEDGTYVFSVNDGVTTMLNSSSKVEKEDSLVMYQCYTTNDTQSCKKTYGYTEINSEYYEINDTTSQKVLSENGNNDKKTCDNNTLYGLLIDHQQYGASLCLNNINEVYVISGVTFRVVGFTDQIKMTYYHPGSTSESSTVVTVNNNIVGHTAFNVYVTIFDPSNTYPNYEIINVGKYYLCVDPSYPCENETCTTEVVIGISSSMANDDNYKDNDYNSTALNTERMITFPSSVYDNKDYLLKFYTGSAISAGPFSTLLSSIVKSYDTGIVVSSMASNSEKGTPSILAFNNFYTKKNYCFDDDNNELISRKANLCKGRVDCSYYFCKNGICKPSSSTCPDLTDNKCNPNSHELQSNCEDGYYLVDGNELVKSLNKNGILFYCEHGACNHIYNYGYFKNADSATNSDIPLIKCFEAFNSEENYYYNNCYGVGYSLENNTCNNVGDIIAVTGSDDKQTIQLNICLFGNGSEKTITFASDSAAPIVKVAHYSMFGVLEANDYQKLIIKADTSSITIVNGNYLLNKNDEVIINSNELGKLYICYNNYICYLDETIGYYYNQMKNYYSDAYPYIQCTFNSQSQCALIDIYKTRCSVSSDKDGSIAGAGELFITTEKDQTNNDRIVYNICLDTTVKQPISYPLGSTNKNSDYIEYIDSYELLISTNNEDSIFPYKPNKYLIGYVTDKTIKLEYRENMYQLTDSSNKVYRKYRMNESEGCPDLDSIIEYELLCPYDPDYDGRYSYYQKLNEN